MHARLAVILVLTTLLASSESALAEELHPSESSFWDWLIDPNHEQVSAVSSAVSGIRSLLDHQYPLVGNHGSFSEYNAANRRRALAEADEMLRFAVALVRDVALLRELAFVLDERGQPAEAEKLLEEYMARELSSKIQSRTRVRLASIHVRLKDFKAAATELEHALGDQVISPRLRTRAALMLAGVYMETGRIAEAVDLLEHHAASPADDQKYRFMLALAYDRHEEISQAHRTLEQLISRDQTLRQVMSEKQNDLPRSYDRHYHAALAYEALGHFSEARAEWAAYAAFAKARYRGRALAHIAELDRLTRTRMKRQP